MTITISREPPRQDGVIRLLEMSDAYMASLYPAESNHLVDVSSLEGDAVSFFVVRLDLAVVGCGALVAAADGTAEMKRVFVDPAVRGLKIGNLLMAKLEDHARESGFSAIRLETGISQPEAIGLYRRSGYVEIGPFGNYGADPLSIFMEKRLD